MRYSIILIFLSVVLLAGPFALAQRYEFPVEHRHLLRNCRGTLIVTPAGITYETGHRQDARSWRYTDLQGIKVLAPGEIELATFEDQRRLLGRDRFFHFRLLQGEIPPAALALLFANTTRPVVSNIPPSAAPGESPGSAAAPLFRVPVKHRHRWGGCDGVLSIYPDRVDFESSDVPRDSRSWRYSDLDGFARPERYRLEFIAVERIAFSSYRTYVFQLKADPPPPLEDYIRHRLMETAPRD